MHCTEHAAVCYQTSYTAHYAMLLTFIPIMVHSLQTYIFKYLHGGQMCSDEAKAT
jgi:hypothetical protein